MYTSLETTWRDLQMKGTHKHTEAELICFDNHRCISQSEESKCMWTHGKDGTKDLFWSWKTSVIVEISQLSFHVFVCVFPPEISSFFGKSFPFLFPFFVLSVLRCFPFHVLYTLFCFEQTVCSGRTRWQLMFENCGMLWSSYQQMAPMCSNG